jgi:iron complex transport system ATP-binding protein
LSKTAKHILELRHLSVGYGEPLLRNLSATFGNGITGIIGNNGKGKTTLLKSLAGLVRPLAGSVHFDERELSGLPHAARARTVSFNFSVNPVSFPISVQELVAMGRYPYINQWARLAREDEKIVEEALELCGIARFRANKVNALSDGERQKAFIAKSVAQQTPLMLFDEPTAFLDYSSKKDFFALLKKLAHAQHKIMLVSSHDIDFLTAYADHLLMIGDNGTTVVGEAEVVTKSSYFKTHFTRI